MCSYVFTDRQSLCQILYDYHCFVRFRQQKTVTWRGFWQKSPRRLGQSSADFQVMWYLVPCVFHHAVRLHVCRNHPWSCDKRLQTCWRRPKKMSFVGGASMTCRTLVRMVGQYSTLGIEQLFYVCVYYCRYIYIHLYLYYSYLYLLYLYYSYVCIYMYNYIYMFTFVYIYIYSDLFIELFMYLYIYMYIHTYLYIDRPFVPVVQQKSSWWS